jgi:hypothetical protein
MHRFLLLVLLLCLSFPGPADAQVHILGRVLEDKTGRPISSAEVALQDVDGYPLSRVVTDEGGNFEFFVRGASAVKIKAGRMGYKEVTTPKLSFENRRLFHLEVRLDPDAILLAPLVIVSASEVIQNAIQDGFQQRLVNGLGHYITRDDVEARNPMLVTDLLRDVPGITLSGGSVGNRPSIRMVRASNRNCATQIWVDGMLINARGISTNGSLSPMDFRIDDVVTPASIEGIEVYRGLSTVPPEFLNRDADCGVIAIWTKRGGRR